MTEVAATLLERERELRVLGDSLTATAQGRGRVLVVEAAAGLGKTSLLRAASEAAGDAGFTCLRARATELERDFAYGCVRQLLEPAIRRIDAGRNELFDGAAALAKPLFATVGVEQPSGSPDRAFSMLHGLYWLVNNLADRGP